MSEDAEPRADTQVHETSCLPAFGSGVLIFLILLLHLARYDMKLPSPVRREIAAEPTTPNPTSLGYFTGIPETATPPVVTSAPATAAPLPVDIDCRDKVQYTWQPLDCASTTSMLPDNFCKKEMSTHFSDFCQNSNRCFVHGMGVFAKQIVSSCSHRQVLPDCTFTTIKESLEEVTKDSNARFSKRITADKGTEVVLDHCHLYDYGRHEILSLWEGKKVMISGDAVARQMFMKLVFMMRGQAHRVNMEHKGHIDYYYVMNQTHDKLSFTVPEEGVSLLQNPVFEVIFKWDPQPSGDIEKHYRRWVPDLHVVSLGMWWNSTMPETAFDEYMKGAMRYAESNEDTGFRFLFLPILTTVEEEKHRKLDRLAKMVDDNNPKQVLSMLGYNQLGYFKPYDGKHHMCGSVKFYPDVGYKTTSVLRDAVKKGHTCRDHYNTGLWRLLFNALGNVERGSEENLQEVCTEVTRYHQEESLSCTADESQLPPSACEDDAPDFLKQYCKDGVDRCVDAGRIRHGATEEKVCTETSRLPKCTFDMVKTSLEEVTRTDNGRFSLKDGKRVMLNHCKMEEFTRHSILQLWRGKSVLLSGDSQMRQFYKKLIAMLRGKGWERGLDFKGHVNYYFVANETHDAYRYGLPPKDAKLIEGQVVEVMFMWNPLPLSGWETELLTPRGVPDLHIASLGAWWTNDLEKEAMDEYMQGAMEFARENADKGYQYLFLPGAITAGFNSKSPPDMERVSRLERLVGLITEPNARSLSMTGYSKLLYFPTTDNLHYMCRTLSFFPNPIGDETVTYIKDVTTRHDCYDYYNINMWFLLFNALASH